MGSTKPAHVLTDQLLLFQRSAEGVKTSFLTYSHKGL